MQTDIVNNFEQGICTTGYVWAKVPRVTGLSRRPRPTWYLRENASEEDAQYDHSRPLEKADLYVKFGALCDQERAALLAPDFTVLQTPQGRRPEQKSPRVRRKILGRMAVLPRLADKRRAKELARLKGQELADMIIFLGDQERAAMRAFANEHGLLGLPEQLSPDGVGPFGESERSWRLAVGHMQRAVTLHNCIRVPETRVLKQVIQWSRDGKEIRYALDALPGVFPLGLRRAGYDVPLFGEAGYYSPQELDFITRHDVIKPAQYLLQSLIHDGLQGGMRARLSWDYARKVQTWGVQPTTLLGGLWGQFARAVAGDTYYKVCAHCKHRFLMGAQTGGKREATKFCGDPCRSAAHYQRNKKRTQSVTPA